MSFNLPVLVHGPVLSIEDRQGKVDLLVALADHARA
jgi:hypothetical protein